MKGDRVTIKIPKPLYDRLRILIEGTGFSSVTEFVVWVMRDVASARSQTPESQLTPEEVQLIRNRLKNLGYLK